MRATNCRLMLSVCSVRARVDSGEFNNLRADAASQIPLAPSLETLLDSCHTPRHRLFTYSTYVGRPKSPVIDNRWSWVGYVHGVSASADAACSVKPRHPRWGVPCVRPCEPYRLLDNEQPCDWNRTRELSIRAGSTCRRIAHPNNWRIAQGEELVG